MPTTAPATLSRPVTVSIPQLVKVLAGVRGATAISFVALTRPEQKLTPFGEVRKLVRVNAMTGCLYERAKAKAGAGEATDRAWGDRDQSALVEKLNRDGTTSYYLPVQLNHASRPLFLVPSPTGRLAAVPAERVQPYLRPERPFAVCYKDYRLDSLVSLALGGRRYRIRHLSPAL